ncbi:MAG TPA: chromate efflux transporter [Chloroflexota bacterium]|nr:chromate efflux transporter [Chloroflexota bacterium]
MGASDPADHIKAATGAATAPAQALGLPHPAAVPQSGAMPLRPPFAAALRFWVKLGFINFGGPAGQIAIMHRELVDEKRWVTESQFLRALNFCMILPGPEAQQLAVYIGWRLHGLLGGFVAGAFFVIPSIFVLMLLSWLAAAHADVPAIRGLLYGIQAVVIAIVVDSVLRVGRRTLKHPILIGFALAAFVALYFLGIAFPWVIVTAALAGLVLQRWFPRVFRPSGHGGEQGGGEHADVGEETIDLADHAPPTLGRNVRMVLSFLVLWLIPFGLLALWRGFDDVLTQEAWFFTKAAFITFGGAYAVLSYVADVVVNQFGWLSAGEMVQGLGLAESTPGPLIMVTQYVGFLAAYHHATGLSPVLAGIIGALITTYATFLPCFMFVFLGAPYIERLSGNRRLQAALVGVTAAVVGVIANLAVFFTSHVLIVARDGLDWFSFIVALASFAVLRLTKVPIFWLVPVGAVLGTVWTLLRSS